METASQTPVPDIDDLAAEAEPVEAEPLTFGMQEASGNNPHESGQ